MMEPIVAYTGLTEDKSVSIHEFQEMYEFLSDEWLAADVYLEQLGFPAQTEDVYGQYEYNTLVKRMMLALGEHEED